MTFPVNFHLFGSEINSHLVFELLAYSLGFRYYLWLRRHSHDLISDTDRIWIFIGAAAGGLVGSRLIGILENPNLLFDPVQHFGNQSLALQPRWMVYWQSKTIVGGLLGGLVGVELTKKRLGIRTSSGDLMVFPLVLGMSIGRIGCFLAGVTDGTHGSPCHGWFCMDLGDGIPRHPAALYEIIFLLTLGVSLYLLERRYTLTNGARFKLFLISYLIFRFWVEFIKPAYPVFLGLSTIQWACLAGFLYYYRVFIYPKLLFLTENAQQIA